MTLSLPSSSWSPEPPSLTAHGKGTGSRMPASLKFSSMTATQSVAHKRQVFFHEFPSTRRAAGDSSRKKNCPVLPNTTKKKRIQLKLQKILIPDSCQWKLVKEKRLLRNQLKVTPDLRGCPRGKNSYARHFIEGQYGKLYIVGKLNKCRFRKKYKLPVSSIPQKKTAINRENDHVSFN